MADILERAVRCDGGSACHCGEAIAALRRIRRDNANFYVRAALRRLDEGSEPCASVREIVRALRRFGRIALR